MLQLRDKEQGNRAVRILETTFYLRDEPIWERVNLLKDFAEIGPNGHERLLVCIASLVESIHGYDGTVEDILRELENDLDLGIIAEKIIHATANGLVEHVGQMINSFRDRE